MLIGYNTNGWAHHDPLTAIEMLAAMGYQSIALTIDHNLLNPYRSDFLGQLIATRRLLDQLKLRSVVETGARYLLNPRVKHEPTLISPDPAERARRVQFLRQAIDIARDLPSECVSLWSGVVRDDASDNEMFGRLIEGLTPVIEYAAAQGVVLGFEPEPGMFIDTMRRFEQLLQRLAPANLMLTLDIGHLYCLGEVPLANQIRHWGNRIVNVHIEDMRVGVHEHLLFGDGEIDFPPVIEALHEVGYCGGLNVELSRHSHRAPEAAQRAIEFLRPLVNMAGKSAG